MPADIPSAFVALKNKLFEGDPWIWLFELRSQDDGPIVGPDGGDFIGRFTSQTLPVLWGASKTTGAPLEWRPWPIKLGEVQDDTKGNVNDLQLAFGNRGTADALLVDNDFLRGHRLYIYLVHASLLGVPTPAFTVQTTVVDATIAWDAVTLRLSAFAYYDFTTPQSLMTRKCRFAYRGKGCAFIGDPGNVELGPCKFDIEACRLRGEWEADNGLPVLHPANFGGFPALLAGPVHEAL